MANVIRLKRGSGSDPAASDLVSGEPAVRTDTGELFFKKDDGSVAKVSGAGGGPDFKYLALRNAANNGAASFPNADFTLVTSGTTTAITPTAANTLLVSVNGVIQKPNTGTSTPSSGFALSGSTIKFGANLSAAPDFILYQESGGIGEPSDETVSEAKLKVSNNPVNGYFLSAQSGNNGGLTWAAPVATSCTGNSATATALATARAINGVDFDGTAAITVTAAAGTLTGTTLNSSVTASSLTSLGDLAGLTVNGDLSLTGANYNVLWDKSDNALEFADNAKAVFGAGSDLEIFHNGGDSKIISKTGNLTLNSAATTGAVDIIGSTGEVKLNYGGSTKLQTKSNGVNVTGRIFCDGASANDRGLIFNDNVKISLGSSNDLEIVHNGTNTQFTNTTGNLEFITTNTAQFLSSGDVLAKFIPSGACELYENGSKKFETISDGANVTGKLGVGTTSPTRSIHSHVADGSSNYIMFSNAGTGTTVLDGFLVGANASDQGIVWNCENQEIRFATNNTARMILTSSGKLIPNVDSTYDLGVNATRWRNVYADTYYGDGSNLTGVGGATGGGTDEVFYENSTTVTTSYSITSNKNAMSAGPITINNSVTVTVPSGSVWTIV